MTRRVDEGTNETTLMRNPLRPIVKPFVTFVVKD